MLPPILNVLPGFPLWVSLSCALLVLPILVALSSYFVILTPCVVPSRTLQVVSCVVFLTLMVSLLTLFLFMHQTAILAALIFFILFLTKWTRLSQQSFVGTLMPFLTDLWTAGALTPLYAETHLPHCLPSSMNVVLLTFGAI